MPNTKIVATLGPASDSDQAVRALLVAGVDVFRLNASHGTQAQHAGRIERVRRIAGEARSHVAILLDLQGPKIRLERFENGGCVLEPGQKFTITTVAALGNGHRASTGYREFAKDVKADDRILLADGAIELRALSTDGIEVETQVIRGGPISDNKGINLPGVQVSSPSLTEKDIADLRFGVEAGVDMIAMSFVRTAADVRSLRALTSLPIVAKIEKPQAWENIEAILDEADGVMVARGDLGVEMALEKVPRIQKSVIRRARRKGRFVITATQMLESMIEHATPTRAEVSDVANAIYDGTDAVMLSAETSTGKYPVEAAAIMDRIAQETEVSLRLRGYQDPPRTPRPNKAQIVADAAYHSAKEANVAAIVVFTSSGSSARLISRYRPPVCIFAITPNERVARALAINFAVVPVLAPEVGSTDEMLAQMDRIMTANGYLKPGDNVVFVAGQPIGRAGTTNLMKLHEIAS